MNFDLGMMIKMGIFNCKRPDGTLQLYLTEETLPKAPFLIRSVSDLGSNTWGFLEKNGRSIPIPQGYISKNSHRFIFEGICLSDEFFLCLDRRKCEAD